MLGYSNREDKTAATGEDKTAVDRTILSRFRDAFDLERPEAVPAVVNDALDKAREQGGNHEYFIDELRRAALEEFSGYTGEHAGKAEESAVTTVGELAVHWFSFKFDVEKPEEARSLVNRVVEYLQRLHEQGYGDVERFYADVLDIALREFKEYRGAHSGRAFTSALHVYDEVTRKTSYFSKKRRGKTTRKLRKNNF